MNEIGTATIGLQIDTSQLIRTLDLLGEMFVKLEETMFDTASKLEAANGE